MIYCVVFTIVCFVISIALFAGKALPWLKDWRAIPEEKKKKINVKALEKNLGVLFLLAAIIFGIAVMSLEFRTHYFFKCMVGWMLLTGLDAYYIEKSKRYFKEK